MRKLIVLIMTSVLATGAVAQADDVNVVKDPGDYITIEPILEDDGLGTTATTLQPSYHPTDDANREYYIMQADFVNPKHKDPGDPDYDADLSFNKASLCLYDPDATDVDTLCGSTVGTIGPGLTTGQNRPHEALQVVVGGSIGNATNNFHNVDGSDSSLVVSESNALRSYKVHFALSHATANTTGWKVRALVEYNTSGDPVYYELTDDENTYDIDTFRAIDTQRTQVTYPDVMPGQASEKTGIATGSYFANHTVSINMQAEEFTNGSDTVAFSDAAPGDVNKFGLECTLDTTTLFVDDGDSQVLVPSSDASSLGGTETAKALDSHDCTLHAGDGVEPDSYDNSVTIGIGAPSS